MAYVYILECKDGTLYTGWTTDIERRISEHNKGTGAKYTRARRPVVLKYFEKFNTNREAMKREYEIKTFSRKDKIKLIDYNSMGL
ncbi:GIY-YIG nuclease family protein [Clostridium sp. Marseille-Q2269]|uniref:GIY-YIG nuclease family protein n=1 Tax=Clostridium sp. Marseille-Q2269 TaxID=2942205 RepID=UPI00207401C0|nr:GIY-YIG nuclease family protein [Clostridium sp. Marseille-Q2269]